MTPPNSRADGALAEAEMGITKNSPNKSVVPNPERFASELQRGTDLSGRIREISAER